jgi:hypothetical protein
MATIDTMTEALYKRVQAMGGNFPTDEEVETAVGGKDYVQVSDELTKAIKDGDLVIGGGGISIGRMVTLPIMLGAEPAVGSQVQAISSHIIRLSIGGHDVISGDDSSTSRPEELNGAHSACIGSEVTYYFVDAVNQCNVYAATFNSDATVSTLRTLDPATVTHLEEDEAWLVTMPVYDVAEGELQLFYIEFA